MASDKQTIKVLVAVDTSECSKRAVKWAANYLKERGNEGDCVALLHVLNVAKPHWYDPLHDKLDAVWNDAVKEAAAVLHEEAKATFAEKQVKFEWVEKKGEPREIIADQLDKNEYAMLVMGRRGLSTVQTILLGSVSDHCLRNAQIPVMIVP